VYADPYDLLTIKLLALHVSQHQDEALVKDIWDRIFQDGTLISCMGKSDLVLKTRTAVQDISPAEALDRIQGTIVPLGQRFHGSDSSFPFRSCSTLLLANNN
jgi:nuclear pore complex protein Nup155